ncbi:helix-turn-helix domain-containing protein [Solidesulfovibrio carbinolicus]|uniref:Helix-turn-helix domain-containing protein n=1 Tax=Solidesulfovibrio carbinolicus TaxID=296842 RepID=A0A4V0YQF3_9BACT|nr:helix-turn-helix domain-containing protein [Solidesulfovibrio carbinolicus]QAZ66102.1 hypothetical protein C3Y92_02135 [Solidesulfovibrio carbinolicus]
MEVCGIILANGLVVPSFFEKLEKQEISLGARCTYGVLAQVSGKSDHCWPSQKYLAERLGVSIRTIQKYLKELVRLGFIAILSGHDGETNTYQLLPHPLVLCELESRAARVSSTPATPEKSSGGHGENIAPVFKKEEKNTPLTPQRGGEGARSARSPAWKPEAIAAFDRVWAVWPVQEARKAALRWWMRLWRLRSLPTLESILASVRAHMAQNPRWKRGFVPFLVTWLKGRRWEDAAPVQPALSESKVLSTPDESASAKIGSKTVGLQGGKGEAATSNAACSPVPAGVWQQLDAVLGVWPGELTEAQLSHVRGTWRYLYSQGQLPAQETLLQIARAATNNFSRWLHVFQQRQNSKSQEICAASWCCTY